MIKISTPVDIAKVVPSALGFVPSDSLVVLGLGHAPTARLDLASSDDIADVITGIAPALSYWTEAGVLVAIYTNDTALAALTHRALPTILPGIEVLASIQVCSDGVVRSSQGEILALDSPAPITPVAASREAVVAETDGIDDAAEAVTFAIAAYLKGDGTRAWAGHDRARALGSQDPRLATLAHDLTNAVRPLFSSLY